MLAKKLQQMPNNGPFIYFAVAKAHEGYQGDACDKLVSLFIWF